MRALCVVVAAVITAGCAATTTDSDECEGGVVCAPGLGCPTPQSEGYCIDPSCEFDGQACNTTGRCQSGGCRPECETKNDGAVCLLDPTNGTQGTCLAGECATASCVCGDVDISGLVDTVDRAMIAQYAVDPNRPLACVEGADILKDGLITAADATVLGMIQAIPPQVTPESMCQPCELTLCGDINGDNTISVADVTAHDQLLDELALGPIDGCRAWQADANGDGVVDAADTQAVNNGIFNAANLRCAAR